MDVILQEDFPSLGYIGDVVEVKRGYARNYLIPKGIAVEMGSANAKALRHVISIINAKKRRTKSEAEERSKSFRGLTLEFTLKGNEHGKVFGAVTSRNIESALDEKGLKIGRKQIRLIEPLKSAGQFEIPIKLHSEVTVMVKAAITVDAPKRLVAAKSSDKESDSSEAQSEASAEGTTEE